MHCFSCTTTHPAIAKAPSVDGVDDAVGGITDWDGEDQMGVGPDVVSVVTDEPTF